MCPPIHLLCRNVPARPALIVLREGSQQPRNSRGVSALRLQPAGSAHCVLHGELVLGAVKTQMGSDLPGSTKSINQVALLYSVLRRMLDEKTTA